jgi:chromosome segregation protein
VYLKRLELFGFKTFSKKTVIEFPHGFMAVVGPNGSGKSNLTDAIRFCLGESQVKALRATKLEELIFAGTPDKSPAPYAEVTAVFDNTDAKLPVDLAEVAITRRLTRDGGSRFAINGTTCRLKDIHEMLMGSGIGPGSFSVLGGKEVDRVLSSDPKDRRMMLEETASVNRYRYRKKEAQRKLDQTDDNLVRLRDILREVGEQLGESKKQLQRYERYQASKDELGNLDRRVALHDVTTLRAKALELTEQVGALEGLMAEARVREEAARRAMDGFVAEKEIADREREKLSAELSALRERNGANGAAKDALKDRRKQIEESLRQADRVLNTGADRVESQMGRLSELAVRRAELNEEQARARQHLEILSEELARLPQEAGGTPAAELRGRRDSLHKRQQLLREETNRHGAEESADKDRQEELEFRQMELGDHAMSEEAATDDSAEVLDLGALERDRAETEESAEKLKARRASLQQELEEQIRNGRELESHRRPLVGRIAELEALAVDHSSLPPAVRAVMRWGNPGVVGLVGELVKVPEGLEVAFEAALGGAVNNVITRDKRVASDLVEQLKRERVGRATFWPLDLSRKANRRPDLPDRRGVVGWALELLGYPAEIEPVLEQLLGRTVIMDDMPTALAMYERCYGQRPHIVTRGGEYLNPSGALTGGAKRSDQSGVLAARSKLMQARQDLVALEKATHSVVSRIEKLQNGIKEAEEALARRQERLQELAAVLVQGRAKDQERSRRQERLLAEKSRLALELEKLAERCAERSRVAAERVVELERIAADLAAIEAQLVGFKQQEDELGQRREALHRERLQAEMRVERAADKLLDLERERQREEERLNDLRSDRARAEQDLARSREGLSALDGEAIRIDEEAQALLKRVEAKTEELRQVRLAHQAIDQKSEGMRQDFARANSALQKHSGEAHRLELERTKVTTQYEDSLARLRDGRSDTEQLLIVAQQTEPMTPAELTGAKSRIGQLRHFLDNFGGVNLGAREDFERLSTRFSGLETQIIDLAEGKESLQKIMRELDQATTHLFTATFEQVNDTFGRLFSDLFGGGQAKLVMCEPDDPLESGVEIMCCPPGKRQQNMMLMSSGERALCAIAFLMSLLACKPSPIVILDELDAPLDERNVEKVATRLLEFSASSQFLVVTHNRKTMEYADRLYGVTMLEPGVSQVLSVELANVEEKLGVLN